MKDRKTTITHIEYDDFGAYEEILEELEMTVPESHITGRACIMKKTISKVTPIALIMTIMFSISALAATCGVKGCYKSTVYGGSYNKDFRLGNLQLDCTGDYFLSKEKSNECF